MPKMWGPMYFYPLSKMFRRNAEADSGKVMQKGTVLSNKRTGRRVILVESFRTLNEKNGWVLELCYRCKNQGQKGWTLINEGQLSKWELTD